MHLSALLVLAFVASGCTIHVVEQPAAPLVLLAEGPRPARPRYVPRPHINEYEVAAAPVAAPVPALPRNDAPRAVRPTRPPRHHTPTVAKLTPPFRVPFRTLPPEARTTHLARVAPTRKHGRQKLARPHPLAQVSSPSVAQSQ